MNTKQIQNLLGASWQTTISGSLVVVALTIASIAKNVDAVEPGDVETSNGLAAAITMIMNGVATIAALWFARKTRQTNVTSEDEMRMLDKSKIY